MGLSAGQSQFPLQSVMGLAIVTLLIIANYNGVRDDETRLAMDLIWRALATQAYSTIDP